MGFKFLDKLFGGNSKKRSNSQPPNQNAASLSNKNAKKNDKFYQSVPNLSARENLFMAKSGGGTSEKTDNLKSFGELMPNSVDTDDDEMNTNFSQTNTISRVNNENLRKRQNESNLASISVQETKKSSAGYESSSSSNEDSKLQTSNVTDFLNTLGGGTTTSQTYTKSALNLAQNKNALKDTDDEETTSLSTTKLSLAEQIKESQKQRNQMSLTGSTLKSTNELNKNNMLNKSQVSNKSVISQNVTFKDPPEIESTSLKAGEAVIAGATKKYDSQVISSTSSNFEKENTKLRLRIEELERKSLEREAKHKQEIDRIMIQFHDTLSKDMKNPNEKNALTKTLLSKQQESNEKLINEQAKVIEALKAKCRHIEEELAMGYQNNNANVQIMQIRDLKEEVSVLKNLVQRLNTELKAYQVKYPSAGIKVDQSSNAPWNVDIKPISSLLETYEEKMLEKDEKLRLMKIKLDDLMSKFKQIIEENNALHTKLDELPESITSQFNEIKKQAELVLEENRMYSQQLELEKNRVYDREKQHLQEISRLSRKIVVSETERVALLNEIDMLKDNNEEIVKKFNQISVESHRKIPLQDHLNQIGDLKRKMEEICFKSKQELEETILKLQSFENERKDLSIKCTELMANNSRLKAQINTLEKSIEKMHPKIQDLEKKIQAMQHKERVTNLHLEKTRKQMVKLNKEKESIEQLVMNNGIEIKKKDEQLDEMNTKVSLLQERLTEYKEKTVNKLAKAMGKIEEKNSELAEAKLSNEKKLSEILKLLQKKQDQIDDYFKEKNQLENEIDNIWHATSSDNEKLKKILSEIKTKN